MSKKYAKKKRNPNKGIIIALILAVIALAAVVICLLVIESDEPSGEDTPTASQSTPATMNDTEAQEETTENVQLEAVVQTMMDLGNNLILHDMGSYTGAYVEDGSNEIVSGVLMIVVTNNSDLPLQYAEFELAVGEETAFFSVSTLPAGASAVLLEQNRMPYEENMTVIHAASKNVAFFDKPLSLCEDKIKIQAMNGAMNITNVSGEDITGDVVIYYKNSSVDMFYGGITYRVRLEGGMAAGEIRQIMSDHFSGTGSTIMFVTCS